MSHENLAVYKTTAIRLLVLVEKKINQTRLFCCNVAGSVDITGGLTVNGVDLVNLPQRDITTVQPR